MRQYTTALRYANQVFNPLALVLLLSADAAFFLLHFSNRLSPRNALLSLATDGGYAEVFQYVKEYWIALVLFAFCWRRREGIYGVWALLFTYVLCDDALTIHETAGQAVATYWAYVPAVGFRAKDFGELTVTAFAGCVFLVLIQGLYVRSSPHARSISKDLTVLLGLLVFFGVFLDMVHTVVEALQVRAVTIIEDGGEMIVMSMTAAYVVHLVGQQGHVAGLLWRVTAAALSGRRAAGSTSR